jgi:hypothetical protein
MAHRQRAALGLPDLPVIVIGHPLGGLRRDEVPTRVREATHVLAVVFSER